MRTLIENDYDDGTLTASSEASGFQASNTKDSRLSRVWRSSGTTENVVVDLGSAVSCDFVAIANHNFTSGATLTLEANSSDSWTSPPFSESLTWDAGIIWKAFTAASYRYWRIVIEDGSNGDGYVKMGRVGLGTYYQLPGFTTRYKRTTRTTTKVQKSQTGQVYADIGYRYRNYTMQWPLVEQAEADELEDMFDILDVAEPTFFVFEETQIDEDGIYARLSFRRLEFQGEGEGPVFYGSRLEIEEAF
jgi:hypothetical protein